MATNSIEPVWNALIPHFPPNLMQFWLHVATNNGLYASLSFRFIFIIRFCPMVVFIPRHVCYLNNRSPARRFVIFFFHPWFKFSCTLFIDEMYNIFCVARMFGRVTNYMAKYFDFCTNSIKKAHFCGELSQTKWDVWWWCWWKLIIYSSCRIEQFVVDCDARGPTRNNFRCWIHLGLEKNSIFALSNGNPSNCIHPQLLQSYTMASDDATKTPQVWIDNRRKNDPNLF